jgi:hypothetical protein
MPVKRRRFPPELPELLLLIGFLTFGAAVAGVGPNGGLLLLGAGALLVLVAHTLYFFQLPPL